MIEVNREILIKAFEAWNNDFKETPKDFKTTPTENYATNCADYLIKLLNKIDK